MIKKVAPPALMRAFSVHNSSRITSAFGVVIGCFASFPNPSIHLRQHRLVVINLLFLQLAARPLPAPQVPAGWISYFLAPCLRGCTPLFPPDVTYDKEFLGLRDGVPHFRYQLLSVKFSNVSMRENLTRTEGFPEASAVGAAPDVQDFVKGYQTCPDFQKAYSALAPQKGESHPTFPDYSVRANGLLIFRVASQSVCMCRLQSGAYY